MYDFFTIHSIKNEISYVRSICCESGDVFGQSSDEGDVLVFHEGVVITARDEGNGSLAVLHTPVTCNTHILRVKISIIKKSLFVGETCWRISPVSHIPNEHAQWDILDTTVLRPHKPVIVWSLTNINRSQIKLIYHIPYVLCNVLYIVSLLSFTLLFVLSNEMQQDSFCILNIPYLS